MHVLLVLVASLLLSPSPLRASRTRVSRSNPPHCPGRNNTTFASVIENGNVPRLGRSLLSFTSRQRERQKQRAASFARATSYDSLVVPSSAFSLFTAPQPFDGPFGPPQRLALLSWLSLSPRPTIWLLGNHPSFFALAKEPFFAGRLFVDPFVDANQFGQPSFGSVIARAAAASAAAAGASSSSASTGVRFTAVVRSTTILSQDIVDVAHAAREQHGEFFLLAASQTVLSSGSWSSSGRGREGRGRGEEGDLRGDKIRDGSDSSNDEMGDGRDGRRDGSSEEETRRRLEGGASGACSSVCIAPAVLRSQAALRSTVRDDAAVALWLWTASDAPLIDSPSPSPSHSLPASDAEFPSPLFLPPFAFDRGYHDAWLALKLSLPSPSVPSRKLLLLSSPSSAVCLEAHSLLSVLSGGKVPGSGGRSSSSRSRRGDGEGEEDGWVASVPAFSPSELSALLARLARWGISGPALSSHLQTRVRVEATENLPLLRVWYCADVEGVGVRSGATVDADCVPGGMSAAERWDMERESSRQLAGEYGEVVRAGGGRGQLWRVDACEKTGGMDRQCS